MALPANLTPHLIGLDFMLARSLHVHVSNNEDMVSASRGCELATNGYVTLQPGTEGVWIPYKPQQATYGMLGNYEWAVSGPFSGCELAVGRSGADVFVAHISIERGRYEARAAFNASISPEDVLYRSRIRLRIDRNYACYVFVSCTDNLEMVRMDVEPRSMGGDSGRIFNVQDLDVQAQRPASPPPSPGAGRAPRAPRAPRRSGSGSGSGSGGPCRCIVM